MTQTSAPRRIVAKSRFVLKIDGLQDLRLTSMGALKTVYAIIKTDEGGAATTAQNSVNTHTFDNFQISRPLTEDTGLADWDDNQKTGVVDIRNGTLEAQDGTGAAVWKWSIEEISIVDYTEFEGDAKATTESMMESCTLLYRKRGKRQLA